MAKFVLVVEDDRAAREALARILRGMGHEVCAVRSAEDAKHAMATFTPNMALLDLRLPGIPGDAFAVYLKHKCPTARIVFMSGEIELDEPERFGSDVVFITKPINVDRVVALIAELPAA